MPWFESSKDKQFRELIEGKMQICLKKPNQYPQAIMILNSQVTKSNQKAIEIIVDHIKQVIKQDEYEPAQKVRAITLLRDLMETHNKALGKYVVTKILKRLTILAQHRKNQNDENRGANIFKCKKSQEKHGIQFLKILLLCIADWGKNWPRNADGPFQDFQNAYNDLLIEKQVRFPLEQRRASKSPVPKTFGNTKPDFTSPPKLVPTVPTDRKMVQNALSKPAIKQRTPVTGPVAEYLSSMIEMLNLLSTTLYQNQQFGEIWSIIKAYVLQFDQIDQKGNFIVAQMIQKGQKNQDIIQTIQANSDFIAELKKDTNTVDKKNQSYGKYNGKYVKNCKKLVLSLSIYLQKPGSSSSAPNNVSQTLKPAQTSINEKVEEVRQPDKPKAQAERNRYGSSYQLRNQLQINLQPIRKEDFNSGTLNKGNQNSEGSSRYNSVSANQLEKNRGSVTQFNQSKQRQKQTNEQGNQKNQRKVQFQKTMEKKESKKEQNKQISKITQKNENQSSFNKFDFDNDIPKNQTQKQNDMFGQFEKSSHKQQKQNTNSNSNFFKQIDGREAPKITRSRKPPNKMLTNQNNNFFDNSIKSKVESSDLSGFEKHQDKSNSQSKSKSQLQKNSKQNVQNSRNSQPKGFDTFKSPNEIARAVQQLKKSDNQSQKSGVSNPFGNPPIDNGDNPFRVENSFYKTEKSFDDPFATNNDKASKINFDDPFASNNDKVSKINFDDPFASKIDKNNSFVDKVNENPFESKLDFKPATTRRQNQQNYDNKSKSSNPFSQKNDVSNKSQDRSRSQIQHKKSQINADNPFDAKSHNSFNISKENPFDNQQPNNVGKINPFDRQKKLDSSKSISQRDSFKNVQKATKMNQKVSSILQDPFESVRNEQKKARTSQQINKSKTEGPQIFKQKQREKSFDGFDFDAFENVKAQTQSVKYRRKQQVQKKHNESAFSLSEFADVRNSTQLRNTNQFQENNFFQKPNKSIQNRKSQQSVLDFFQQNSYANQKPEKDNPFETSNREIAKQKPMLTSKDFFESSKQEESKNVQNITKSQKRNSNQFYNFDDFQNVSKNIKSQQNSNSNPFAGFEQPKGTIDPIKKEEAKPSLNQSSDLWDKFGKVSNESSDEWKKFANIAQKQSEDSRSKKNQESKYEPSENGSKMFDKMKQVPWINDKKDKNQPNIIKQSIPKIDFQPQPQQHKQPRFGNSQRSLSLHFDEPSPFQKKQIPWQYTPNNLPSSIRYNIKPQDIMEKRQVLMGLDQQHQARQKRYYQMNQMLTMLKKQYAGSLDKLGQIRGQNRDFKLILKRIKQTNRLKQIEIQDLIKKKRKAEQIKTKMLEKERQLYQIMKSQRRVSQDPQTRQRIGNKWQKFNQNLQKHRQMTQFEKTVSHFSYYA